MVYSQIVTFGTPFHGIMVAEEIVELYGLAEHAVAESKERSS
jgi:hypothetical protein